MKRKATRNSWFTAAFAAVAMLVLGSLAPAAHAGSVLAQPETKIYRTSQYVDQPQDEVFDVLNARDITVQVKVTEEGLSPTKYAKINLQTSNSRSGQDWQTMETVTYTKSVDSTPLLEHMLVNVDHATYALGRYLRWQVEFEDTTATQWIAFKITAAARN